MKIGSRTPWGKADHVKEVAPGIWQVSTPGHGGYKLDRVHNATVDAAWRRPGGWYEEDCEWAIVVLTFEQTFREQAPTDHVFRSTVVNAHSTARNYYPDQYTAVTGQTIPLAESRVLREREHKRAVVDKLVVVSAWGDWHPAVPKGFVGVFAVLGGVRVNFDANRISSLNPGKYFLVSEAEYKERNEFGFVIDESKHQVWAGENATGKVAAVVTILEAT
jgi:hypothetical protein